MDNTLYRTIDNSHIEANVNEGDDENKRLYIALSRVVKSRDWKLIVEKYLKPALENSRHLADTSVPPELYRAQGDIRTLKAVINLDVQLTVLTNLLNPNPEHAENEEA